MYCPTWSCLHHGVFASLSEKQLPNQTSFTVVKKTPSKSCLISTKILSGVKKSILCAVIGGIFKFLKIKQNNQFFVKFFDIFTKNWTNPTFFKNFNIRPTTAQTTLFFRPHKFFVEIGQDLSGVFFTSVNDVWFWSCFYCNLWNTPWYMQLDTGWCIVFLTSYTPDICMGLIGNTCFKGTLGVLKHYSGLPMANPGGPLNIIATVNITIHLYIQLLGHVTVNFEKSKYVQNVYLWSTIIVHPIFTICVNLFQIPQLTTYTRFPI